VAASLSNTFKLIAHPRFGKGCKAFKDKAIRASHDLCALIDEALSQGAISALEAQQVHEAIAQQPNDGTYLDEWVQLIQQCLISSHQ
jgi:phage terminase large subunit-like protein